MLFNNAKLLHNEALLTNKSDPICSYITKYGYPEQDTSKLGEILYIWYRSDDKVVSKYEPDDTYTSRIHVYVLRWDNEYPFIKIGIAHTGEIYVIRDTNNDPDIPTKIAIYPEQQYKFYELHTQSMYGDYTRGWEGQVITCYGCNPGFAVVTEIVDNQYLRFITSDEAIFGYMDPEEPQEPKNELTVYNLIADLLEEYRLYGSNN